jgi:glycosyltransferase involved in cell wall biosynthesis
MLAAGLTERHTVRRAMHVIAISPYVARYYGDDLRGHVYEIDNAVAPEFFQVRRRPEQGRFLYAGRISNGKGLFELLAAVAHNRGVVSQLVLAGAAQDSEYKARVAAEAARLEIAEKVTFAGLLDDGALLEEFGRATALVLPSHQETAPMVVQQAMAAGLPVIATTVGGIPDQLDHGVTGWLFAPGDVAGLAALVGKAATDVAEGARLAEAARRIATERFQASAVAAATIAVYRSILEAPHVEAR